MSLVSAIVAARNEEAHIAETVRSLAAQPEIGEIIVVNDQSTDGTAGALAQLAAEIPQLRVLDSGDLPAGWVGKNHALWLGAADAKSEWLLFTDADVTHLPGSAARALADAQKHDADLVSYSPEQELHTWWERALIPLVFSRLERHFPYGRINDAYSRPAANGQYILVKRNEYFAIGGHKAVGGEVLEDVAMARRARSAGCKIYFAPGEGIARTRMYRSFRQMWEGWRKNLYQLVGGTPGSAFREMVSVFPKSLLLIALVPAHSIFALWGGMELLREHTDFRVAMRAQRLSLSSILYCLPARLLYAAAVLSSALAYAQGRVIWKGREYPVGVK